MFVVETRRLTAKGNDEEEEEIIFHTRNSSTPEIFIQRATLILATLF